MQTSEVDNGHDRHQRINDAEDNAHQQDQHMSGQLHLNPRNLQCLEENSACLCCFYFGPRMHSSSLPDVFYVARSDNCIYFHSPEGEDQGHVRAQKAAVALSYCSRGTEA